MIAGFRLARALMIPAVGCAAVVMSMAAAQQPAQQSSDSPDFIASLRAVRNGLATIDALNLPPSFLQHAADEEVRGSFRAGARRIAPDPAPAMPVAAAETVPPMPGVDVRTVQLPDSMSELWTRYAFTEPNIVGFRAPLGALAENPGPFDLTQKGDDAPLYREAAIFVATNLARDGVIKTTMRLMARSKLDFIRDGELNLNRLRAVGVPADLLAFFTIDNQPAQVAMAKWMTNGGNSDSMVEVSRQAKFEFAPAAGSGFQVLAEDGSDTVGALRFQLPTHRYRMGQGDGSVLDVFRQLVLTLPDVPVWVSMHEQAMPTLMRALSVWGTPSAGRIVLVPHAANATQWAQDDAKVGTVPRVGSGARGTITLAPRYASRTESRTTFVPSDSFVMESLNKAGLTVVQSPLLFQGGNLLPITDPRNGMRILLVGEAEIHRNVALGLTFDQVQQAFAIEFGVSRVLVIPAVSFHIDLDMTIRRCNGELVACVTDDLAASRIVYSEGLKSLASAGAVPSDLSAQFEGAATDVQRLSIMNRIMAAMRPLHDADGAFSSKFAAVFVKDPLESPAGNAQRFLAAADILLASLMSDRELADPSMPLPFKAYVVALKRQQLAREALVKQLTGLGMRVALVPGLNDHDVGVNYVNGIHMPGKYLMPVFGGWFQPLDRAATERIGEAFGPSITIVPIMTGMAQASDGGLHCMMGLYPAGMR